MSCPITGEPRCKCKYVIESNIKPTLKDTLRKLFTDHANFTHLYIIAEVNDLPSLQPITMRLLQNQDDIGMAIQATYDPEKGQLIGMLLRQHILVASGAVKSAKKYTIAKILYQEGEGLYEDVEMTKNCLDVAIRGVFENSAEVSAVLSSLNPELLPYDVVKSYFDEHNQYVIDIATLYLQEKDEEAVKEYDCYYTHMLAFSDMLVLK